LDVFEAVNGVIKEKARLTTPTASLTGSIAEDLNMKVVNTVEKGPGN
jgi:hypothetical protein